MDHLLLNLGSLSRWEMSSAVPSFLHGLVTLIVSAKLLIGHIKDHGSLLADSDNKAEDIALLQFSCVRRTSFSFPDRYDVLFAYMTES
jgi:hypothetical protein